MKRPIPVTSAILLITIAFAADSSAQTTTSDALYTLFSGIGFSGGALPPDVADIVVGVIRTEATAFPISSSSGGFTWTLDPLLGVQTRRSKSFGPMFAERPLTTGHGKLNVGLAYQRTTFTSLAGQPLDDLRFTQTDKTQSRTLTYETSLEVAIEQTVFSLTYGVSDRVDVGVVVPVVRNSVSGTNSVLVSSGGTVQKVTRDQPITASGSGFGDFVGRVKVGLASSGPLSLSAGVDVRLAVVPVEDLFATQDLQAKVMLIGALERGAVSPHFNIGYTLLGGDGIAEFPLSDGSVSVTVDQSPEFNVTAGVDVVLSPSVSLAGDIIGRSLRKSATVALETIDTPVSSQTSFTYHLGNVNLLLGAIGAKINVGGQWLLTGSVLFPLNNNGVKPGVTPVIGFERAF